MRCIHCMNTEQSMTPTRQAAINGLAVVGFVALVAAGLWLAIYSTRFVPAVVNRIGSAAVYLGSVFTPADEPTLSVVPNPVASTTISFGNATTSTAAKSAAPVKPKPIATTPGIETSNTYPMSGTGSTPTFSGLPDLITTINAVGYSATSSTESSAVRKSFVASSTVPVGFRPAVNFTIKNIGTNVTGQWHFSASIPTQTAFIYQSKPQDTIPLNPGDSIDYIIAFDQAIAGSNKMISISANFDRTITESDFNNNNASAQLTILGG